jgi:hypothetical protein
MNHLIVFRDDQGSFEPDEVRRILENIPGTRDLKETAGIGSGIGYEFAFNGDKTFVRLAKDFLAMTIHGTGEASQQAALEIQRRHGEPLRVTDLDYGFDLPLSQISSVQDFTKKIRDAYAVPDTT